MKDPNSVLKKAFHKYLKLGEDVLDATQCEDYGRVVDIMIQREHIFANIAAVEVFLEKGRVYLELDELSRKSADMNQTISEKINIMNGLIVSKIKKVQLGSLATNAYASPQKISGRSFIKKA